MEGRSFTAKTLALVLCAAAVSLCAAAYGQTPQPGLPGALAQPPPPPTAAQVAALEEQLRQRLTGIDPSDSVALFEAAMWASRNGLDRHAEEILARIVGLDADNARARQALRQVRIGTQWYSLAQAAQILSAEVTAAGYDAALTATIQQMHALAQRPEEKAAVEALSAHVRLCQGAIAEAAATFGSLAPTAPVGSPTRTRLATIADILTQNPDGLYVLAEPFPSEAVLLDQPGQIVPAGPASLTDPRVLAAALRDRARSILNEGVRQLEQARLLIPPGDSPAIEQACRQATSQFDQADGLVADISRSYRVDMVRFQVELLRKRADTAAASFDAELAALGRQELPLEAYKAKLTKMLGSARQVRHLAQPYPKDLVMEIGWAEQNRTKMQSIQETLRQELYEAH
jgi:hypothetical protein